MIFSDLARKFPFLEFFEKIFPEFEYLRCIRVFAHSNYQCFIIVPDGLSEVSPEIKHDLWFNKMFLKENFPTVLKTKQDIHCEFNDLNRVPT